ncbi:hypothetical protein GCM10010495_60830 [Kitasatospora herbaricolor]|uniref:DUF5988 family protein n=1 Tax=Kitasatospora herbaricolor TaxID=68217 RepID=UPI00174CDC88|nr:DUF5988 family protein [Kitasatospora herbaricolor]MDQ0312759.1 hypothetical protein [Kitasatospora herbaricolor]GGV35592.1 hypothetical protein GCM10010495_60830 [Kitasatospora herbaricolor]
MSDKHPNVILLGGPAGELPDDHRIHHVTDLDTTLKLFRGNRYEHYRPTPETLRSGADRLRVFTWSHSTFVAE